MSRRAVLALLLVVASAGSVAAVDLARGRPAGGVEAGVGLEIRLPLPALPIGPGPLYPLDSYGPRADDDAALRWSEQTLAAIRALKTGPTVNARALAIVHTAMYDAWAAYDGTAVGTRLGGTLRRPAAERTDAYKSAAVSMAGYRALLNLFPTRAADFRGLMTAMGYDPDDAHDRPGDAGRGRQPGRRGGAGLPRHRRVQPGRRLRRHHRLRPGQQPGPGRRPDALAAAAGAGRRRRLQRAEVRSPRTGAGSPRSRWRRRTSSCRRARRRPRCCCSTRRSPTRCCRARR